MKLGDRIKECRQNAGLSQEKVAELVGVSRQAVTKWETGQSAPNTENLFKLAEIFGTTVDLLLAPDVKDRQSPAEQFYSLYKLEQEKKSALRKQRWKRNSCVAALVAGSYLVIYLIGRILWCDPSQTSLVGWFFTAIPTGKHSYLYGWLLSQNLFWFAMAISVVSALFGTHRFAFISLTGFLIGILAGMLFGPNPAGEALGQGHYGWAIWGILFLVSVVAGIVAEFFRKKRGHTAAEESREEIL